MGAALAALVARRATAEPSRSEDQAGPEPAQVLSYSKPQQPHYLRVTLEQLALLGAGLAQYWYDKDQNSRDWQFNYDWPSFRARLEGKAYAFDTNGFDTNFLFHPTSGTLYYWSARSNHLGPFESLAVAFASSAIWEFFGEFQEKVSVNDVVVTPLAGMAWGETTTQLSAYFARACPSTLNQIAAATLAPLSALHDGVDGIRALPACDSESPLAHRFRFSLSTEEAWSEGGSPYPALRAAMSTEVMHLPGFARVGNGWTTFSDGNVSRFGLAATFSALAPVRVSDFSLLTQTMVAGLHYRDNRFEGGVMRRHEALFGLLVGAEYTRHRYQPDAPPDRVFLLDLPALSARYYGSARELGWELTLDVGGAFGGADSPALAQAGARRASLDLTSVAAAEGYNHVVGLTLSPRARFDLGVAEAGIDFRSERLVGWRALDREDKLARSAVSELRRRSAVWVAFGARHLERVLVTAAWTERSSALGDVTAHSNELSLSGGIELAP